MSDIYQNQTDETPFGTARQLFGGVMSQFPDPGAVAMDRPSQGMFVVRGRVSGLQQAHGTLNLLQSMRSSSSLSALTASLTDEHGQVANASMLAMYDGEDVEHFGCHLGEDVLLGTFPDVTFQEDDEIKAIVTQVHPSVLKAHAVFRPKDNFLWVPVSASKGYWQMVWWLVKAFFWVDIFGLVFLSIFALTSLPTERYLEFILPFVPGFLVFSALAIWCVTRSSQHDADYAEEIMRVVGFRRPKLVNLSPFSQARLNLGGPSYQIYDIKRALLAYNSLTPGQTILDK